MCNITSTTSIVAGATSLNSGSQPIRVKNAINHPNYNNDNFAAEFDYSIAKQTSPLSKDSYRYGRNTPTLIFENLKAIEKSKNHFIIIWTSLKVV